MFVFRELPPHATKDAKAEPGKIGSRRRCRIGMESGEDELRRVKLRNMRKKRRPPGSLGGADRMAHGRHGANKVYNTDTGLGDYFN